MLATIASSNKRKPFRHTHTPTRTKPTTTVTRIRRWMKKSEKITASRQRMSRERTTHLYCRQDQRWSFIFSEVIESVERKKKNFLIGKNIIDKKQEFQRKKKSPVNWDNREIPFHIAKYYGREQKITLTDIDIISS